MSKRTVQTLSRTKQVVQNPQIGYQQSPTTTGFNFFNSFQESPRQSSSPAHTLSPRTRLPLLFFDVHGEIYASSFQRDVHLRKNEYLICPEWDQITFSEYECPFFEKLSTEKPTSLKNLLQIISELFPPTKRLQDQKRDTQPMEFQIFDSSVPLFNFTLSIDEALPGFMFKLLPQKRTIGLLPGKSTKLSSLVSHLRKKYPNGWILFLNSCLHLDIIGAKRREFLELTKTKYKGFRLFEYFPNFEFMEKSPKSPITVSLLDIPDIISKKQKVNLTPTGCEITLDILSNPVSISFVYIKPPHSFSSTTQIFTEGRMIGSFRNPSSFRTVTESLTLPTIPCVEFKVELPYINRKHNLIRPKLKVQLLFPIFNKTEFTLTREPLFSTSFFSKLNKTKEDWEDSLEKKSWFITNFQLPDDEDFFEEISRPLVSATAAIPQAWIEPAAARPRRDWWFPRDP